MNTATPDNPIEWIRSGVDWTSASFDKAAMHSDWWYERAKHAVVEVHREGHTLKARSLLGFDGLSAGNCFAGENPQRYYCQLSGSYADAWYDQLDDLEPHYSRIDLQVTVRFAKEELTIARNAYSDLLSGNARKEQRYRPKAYIILGSDGGDTLYVGAPSSRQRCRIYNKAKQSEQAAYENCWRYEVVFRDELARDWAEAVRLGPTSVSEAVIHTVGAWLKVRGIAVPFEWYDSTFVLPKIRTLPTDVERKLEWLRTQVAPSVAYLCDLGFRETILETLGLVLDQGLDQRTQVDG